MEGRSQTAGETIAFESELGRIDALIATSLQPLDRTRDASLSIRIEADRAPFATEGWEVLARSAVIRDGTVVLHDVCTSGFDVRMRASSTSAEFVFRRTRSHSTLLNAVLPARGKLIARSALVQYPAMWWAATRGRAPVHAAAVRAGEENLLLIGASGVGKSTLVELEAASSGRAVSDNLCVSDGRTVWGVVEPMRTATGPGARTSRGRRERPLPQRMAGFEPDRIVVLRRGDDLEPGTRTCPPAAAARLLTAGTYMAGELRRFWPFTATLAAATPTAPAHPPVREVAEALTDRVPSIEVVLPDEPGLGIGDLLGSAVTTCV